MTQKDQVRSPALWGNLAEVVQTVGEDFSKESSSIGPLDTSNVDNLNLIFVS
jgi:hypothetical protein